MAACDNEYKYIIIIINKPLWLPLNLFYIMMAFVDESLNFVIVIIFITIPCNLGTG